MSVKYAAVKWNRNKRTYDLVVAAGVLGFVAAFVAVGKAVGGGGFSNEVLLLRGLGACAFFLLHVVLCIGPLARLDRRFAPVLYNRRHLGVATFGVAAAHGLLATGYYHGFGSTFPLLSLLGTNTEYGSLSGFPFEALGLAALLILFVMAATSHDFWQKNLSPGAWKAVHMLVYPAYLLVVLHVALGALQGGRLVEVGLVAVGAATVTGLHLAVGWRERRRDGQGPAATDGWVDAGSVDDIPDGRARVVCGGGRERIAVFRYGDRVSAVTNVCAHQRGPLGEGKIVDGCISCPWHGWEYRPEDGRSPPPFHEKIATYRVRLDGRQVFVDPRPLPPGTPTEPARIKAAEATGAPPSADEFFIGWLPTPMTYKRFLKPWVLAFLAGAAATAGLAALGQRGPGPGRWDDSVQAFVGTAANCPYAVARVRIDGEPSPRTLLLVSDGKFGATARLAEILGGRAEAPVRLTGTVIRRDGRWLLEVLDGPAGLTPLAAEEAPSPALVRVANGPTDEITVRGEVVDAKCYLGAMRPGEGKTHKACAMLCIAGGIPPLLVSRDAAGAPVYFLLATADGGPAADLVLPVVGETVEARGRVEQVGDLRLLKLTSLNRTRR